MNDATTAVVIILGLGFGIFFLVGFLAWLDDRRGDSLCD